MKLEEGSLVYLLHKTPEYPNSTLFILHTEY